MIQRLTNNLSRIVLIVGALAIMAMILFPPWHYTVLLKGDNLDVPGGYAFITSPPEPTQARCPACWYEVRSYAQATKGDELDNLIASLPDEKGVSSPSPESKPKGTLRQYRTSVKMDTQGLTIQILGGTLVCVLLALAGRKR